MKSLRLGLLLPGLATLAVATVLSGCAAPVQPGELPEKLFWVHSCMVKHGFSPEETAEAMDTSVEEVHRLRERLREIELSDEKTTRIRVLPYPGGRHPRIGFLDGAIDPQRDTKVSVFLPWEDAGYVVIDLPEAIWWNDAGGERELLYLAHTHLPTHWTKKGVELEPIDWSRGEEGQLEYERRLPNGVAFGARVIPRPEHVDLELWMLNGSERAISGLDTQICVLLKGAEGFNAQTNDNKVTIGETVATRSENGNRYIITHWEGGEVWNNPPCPCMHSNPSFPELAPGQRATRRGKLYFHVGDDLTREVERHQETVRTRE